MSRNVLNRDSSTFNEDFREDTTTRLYVKADARTITRSRCECPMWRMCGSHR